MAIANHPTKNKHLAPDYTGPRWWYIITYPRGRKGGKDNAPFFGTKAAAQAEDLRVRKSIRKAPASANPQFSTCLPDFIAWYALDRAPGTVEAATRHLIHLAKHMGRLPLTAISPAVVDAYKRSRLADGVKHATINNELIHLNVLFTWAKEENLIGDAVKCKPFPAKLTRSPIPSMPTRAEFEAIVSAVRPEVRGIAMLEFYAGLRRSEAMNIKAENVFIERGLIVITGKGNKQRIVPVQHKPLLDELAEKMKTIKAGYLWVNPVTGRPYRNVRDSLRTAAKVAGVGLNVYPHLLRHGFGTGAAESGISQRTLQELMGHSDIQTTGIYTHLAATHLISEMRKLHPLEPVDNKKDGQPLDSTE